jgi:hypothetical protein
MTPIHSRVTFTPHLYTIPSILYLDLFHNMIMEMGSFHTWKKPRSHLKRSVPTFHRTWAHCGNVLNIFCVKFDNMCSVKFQLFVTLWQKNIKLSQQRVFKYITKSDHMLTNNWFVCLWNVSPSMKEVLVYHIFQYLPLPL